MLQNTHTQTPIHAESCKALALQTHKHPKRQKKAGKTRRHLNRPAKSVESSEYSYMFMQIYIA